MIYALSEDNQRICARLANKKGRYYCPVCGKCVSPKPMNDKVWQFYHNEPCTDTWKYDMSEWRYLYLMQYIKPACEVYINRNSETHRADVCIGDTVIMFFHTAAGLDDANGNVIERTDFFVNSGYRVLLVYDAREQFGKNILRAENGGQMYFWENAPELLSLIVQRNQSNIAVVLQLTDEQLIKVNRAKKNTDAANSHIFYTDSYYKPDILTSRGIKDVFLPPKERYTKFLEKNKPYTIKTFSANKGFPFDYYICPMQPTNGTSGSGKNWHNNNCENCRYNLIIEFRHSGYNVKKFYYCCFPRVVSRQQVNIHNVNEKRSENNAK